MKRLICCLLALLMMIQCLPAWAESNPDTPVSYEDLSEQHRALFEAEMASALANARARAPGQSRLYAMSRGEFNGYTGTKADNSLSVEYKVTDSVVAVGEKVVFYVTMKWDYGHLTYTFGGQMMDENFVRIGPLAPTGSSNSFTTTETGPNVIGRAYSVVPKQAGFFNFVIVLEDGNGNSVSLTTPTIQVYDGEQPSFVVGGTDRDIGMAQENLLTMRAYLDQKSTRVGMDITASAEFSTLKDPVKYTATWTLEDENGNQLDVQTTTGESNASAGSVTVHFPYKPLKSGELQFVIDATDGDGNHVKLNSPWLTVEDGYYFTARLSRVSAMMVGDTVTAIYEIHGHECEAAGYYIGWECYDEAGTTILTDAKTVTERSGRVSYTPRQGQGLEFYVGATCEHIGDAYPARVNIALVGALQSELELTADTVKSGQKIGLTYSLTDGLTPYQSIVIKGYSRNTAQNKTYQFMTQTVTDAQGTVYGTPYLGDEVYFVVEVVERDGNLTTLTSGKAALTGAPAVTDPVLTASVSPMLVSPGGSVTLTYSMSGGSGTLDKSVSGSSYLLWKKSDGTELKKTTLTSISGTSSITLAEEGEYVCELVLTDAYKQQITWRSGVIQATDSPRFPGDANDSGEADIQDALLIMHYCAGWSVSLNKSNADVNGSGSVELNDALLILRYGAGEDVVLK